MPGETDEQVKEKEVVLFLFPVPNKKRAEYLRVDTLRIEISVDNEIKIQKEIPIWDLRSNFIIIEKDNLPESFSAKTTLIRHLRGSKDKPQERIVAETDLTQAYKTQEKVVIGPLRERT